VFALDESGSMGGKPWADLVAAYNMFLRVRGAANQGTSRDIVSVVLHDHEARVITQNTPLAAAPTALPFQGRGNNFVVALQQTKAVVDATPAGYTPVLLFMSDGGCGTPSEPVMESIFSSHRARGLQVHVVAFGCGADSRKLQALAAAGRGTFHNAPDGAALGHTFASIAAQGGVATEMIKAFGSYVSENIANKLALEYM
jgi:uncharacterized protein YegL